MRGCFERNGSKRSCKREAYPYLRGAAPCRTVPKSRVNAVLKFIRMKSQVFTMALASCRIVPFCGNATEPKRT